MSLLFSCRIWLFLLVGISCFGCGVSDHGYDAIPLGKAILKKAGDKNNSKVFTVDAYYISVKKRLLLKISNTSGTKISSRSGAIRVAFSSGYPLGYADGIVGYLLLNKGSEISLLPRESFFVTFPFTFDSRQEYIIIKYGLMLKNGDLPSDQFIKYTGHLSLKERKIHQLLSLIPENERSPVPSDLDRTVEDLLKDLDKQLPELKTAGD